MLDCKSQPGLIASLYEIQYNGSKIKKIYNVREQTLGHKIRHLINKSFILRTALEMKYLNK